MTRGHSQNPPSLGEAVRAIRTEKGLSLAATGKLTGMSVATLSKVENGKRTLAYDKLVALSHALNVDIPRLFASDPVPAPAAKAAGRRSVQKKGDGFVIKGGAYTYTYLAHDLSRKQLSPVIMDLHARTLEAFGELLRHEGEEHAIVLEGEVTVVTDVYEPLRLAVGDSIYLDSNTGHAYLNGGTGTARILCTASSSPLNEGAISNDHDAPTGGERKPPIAPRRTRKPPVNA